MGVRHRNSVRMLKVVLRNVINEVRRLCFGSALERSNFLEKVFFVKKRCILLESLIFLRDELSTLRVGRPVTRLKAYWAFP